MLAWWDEFEGHSSYTHLYHIEVRSRGQHEANGGLIGELSTHGLGNGWSQQILRISCPACDHLVILMNLSNHRAATTLPVFLAFGGAKTSPSTHHAEDDLGENQPRQIDHGAIDRKHNRNLR